jgi:hypothetical protein
MGMDTVGSSTQAPPQATRRRRTKTRQPPTWTELIGELASLLFAPAFYGPPAILVIGPWLLLALSLAGPFLLIVTFVLVAGSLLALVAGLLATGYAFGRLLHLLTVRVHRLSRRAPDAVAQVFTQRAQAEPTELATQAIATRSSSQGRLTSGAS